MIRKFSWLLVLVFFVSASLAQNNPAVIDYINTYKQLAIEEMLRTGVPASITLAQGIHETEAGRSDLVLRSNNHFGIKCKTGWSGGKVYHDDDARGECFRSYTSASESYVDHSNFLKNGSRYAFLFELDPTDYKGWAYGLKKAGYATNIKYSQILIKYIEDYNLQQYSLIALGKLTPDQEILAGNGSKPVTDVVAISNPGPNIPEQPALVEPSYPQGEFTINRTRVIYAAAGTSLLALAEKYDISIGRLLDFNEMEEEDVLIQGQLIFLQRKRRTGSNPYHIVEPGETMYIISQREGVRLEALETLNGLTKGQQPAIGEKIYLQGQAPSTPRLQSAMTPAVETSSAGQSEEVAQPQEKPVEKAGFTVIKRHVVRSRETLYGIARMYNTTAEKIIEWNRLQGTQLKKGQELIIYKN